MSRSSDDIRAYLAARVRRHRLAQAANSAPIRLTMGHFAPPAVRAVWALPCFDDTHVVQIVWHEDGDVFGCRIGPVGAV